MASPKMSARTVDYAANALAENTRKAYGSDVKRFLQWGGTIPSAPQQILDYIEQHASTHKHSTLTRWLASLAVAHDEVLRISADNPVRSKALRTLMRGIARVHGTKQRRVSPLSLSDLTKIVASNGESLRGIRDTAILTVGFYGALRRSEIAALRLEDITFESQGALIDLGRTKTDHDGSDSEVYLPAQCSATCPVSALRRWIEKAHIASGPVFRAISRTGAKRQAALGGGSVAIIVKYCAERVGVDARRISGHSLRAGFVTTAVSKGKRISKIQAQTRHRSITTLMRYVREEENRIDNAAAFEN